MAETSMNLKGLRFWGGPNEEKIKGATKWNHDIHIYVTVADALKALPAPEDLILVIAEVYSIEDFKVNELYEGVSEYVHPSMKIELSDGSDFTMYKIYSNTVDFDTIAARLTGAGLTQIKPDIEIEVPDRPPIVNVEEYWKPRFQYRENIQQDDLQKAKMWSLKSMVSNLIVLLILGGGGGFVYYTGFVTKYIDVTPPDDSYIGVRNNLLAYNVENRLHLFKFAENVEELGVDSTSIIMMPEDAELGRRVAVDKLYDMDENLIYELGPRQIDFTTPITDFELLNSNKFEFDSYRNRRDPEGDWSKFGELGRGDAKKIILSGKIWEEEDGYYLAMGRGFAKLGDRGESIAPFYNELDPESYLATLWSIKYDRPVRVYGQIVNTLSSREGRDKENRKLFNFQTAHVRMR